MNMEIVPPSIMVPYRVVNLDKPRNAMSAIWTAARDEEASMDLMLARIVAAHFPVAPEYLVGAGARKNLI